MDLGVTAKAIVHRVARGRLHPVRRGVYASGRVALLSREGKWMAALLSCGPGAALSHGSAAARLGIGRESGHVEVSVPQGCDRRAPGITIHRRAQLEVVEYRGIPVTSPVLTLVDIAPGLSRDELEAAVSAADKLDLVDPEALRSVLDEMKPRPGVGILRATIDRRTFSVTDSALERRFLPLARGAGLAQPQTGCILNGYKVDFHWPDLGLVVETDGLRYHRTAAQQAQDRRRDQAHAAAGLTCLRFARSQVVFEPEHVVQTLRRVARRLSRERSA